MKVNKRNLEKLENNKTFRKIDFALDSLFDCYYKIIEFDEENNHVVVKIKNDYYDINEIRSFKITTLIKQFYKCYTEKAIEY